MVTDFTQLEQRLNSFPCPVCKSTHGFMIPPDSRITDGEYKAFCKGCRYSMPMHTDMEAYLRNQPDVSYWVKGIRCPSCLKIGTRIDFWIQPSVRNAIYFVTCTACQHQFNEMSALEAYE